MTHDDVVYVQKLLQDGLIESPCLELGVGYEEGYIMKEELVKAGVTYLGTDMVDGPAVDYVVDFEADFDVVQQKLPQAGTFGTVLVLNVLEHSFEPIKILDNVFKTLKPGGYCVNITPAVWPLHSYPYDCYRLLPNFYEEYCKRRSFELIEKYFEYVGKSSVRGSCASQGYAFPKPGETRPQQLKSRIVHKLFNTTGREMFFPSLIAIGCVMRKPK